MYLFTNKSLDFPLKLNLMCYVEKYYHVIFNIKGKSKKLKTISSALFKLGLRKLI